MIDICVRSPARPAGGTATFEGIWDSPPRWLMPHRSDPEPAYLAHAIAPEARLAAAVRLKMHGSIRLKKWRAFEAEEVIHLDRGFFWRARVGMISGFDALVDGKARMKWKMFGVLPVMSASDEDTKRSSIGRWLAESVWLPTMLLPKGGALWEGSSVTVSRLGISAKLDLTLNLDGGLRDFRMGRWGNPGTGTFGEHPFGGVVDAERTFDGYTIPSQLRIGWHFGTAGWTEGEFFRVTVDEAEFR